MSLSTPIVLIVFNRPYQTQKVFDQIRQVKPKTLLIIADGPRYIEESEKIEKVRNIVRKIDWKCEVSHNFSDINMGVRSRITSGLKWVFEYVEEAIIIEDDCFPALSFFQFCSLLLEKYRDNDKIMHIGGNSILPKCLKPKDSYYFSKYAGIWGWASWRRAWKHFDNDMTLWPDFKKSRKFSNLFSSTLEKEYWSSCFDKAYNHSVDTWDFTWQYSCWLRSGLSIRPTSNLVANIGFGFDATHTTSEQSPFPVKSLVEVQDIRHPAIVKVHNYLDNYVRDHWFIRSKLSKEQLFISKLFNTLYRIRN